MLILNLLFILPLIPHRLRMWLIRRWSLRLMNQQIVSLSRDGRRAEGSPAINAAIQLTQRDRSSESMADAVVECLVRRIEGSRAER